MEPIGYAVSELKIRIFVRFDRADHTLKLEAPDLRYYEHLIAPVEAVVRPVFERRLASGKPWSLNDPRDILAFAAELQGVLNGASTLSSYTPGFEVVPEWDRPVVTYERVDARTIR